MKIRDKLFLGFGLYIFLAAILGFFAYKELRTITTRLTLVEIADDITNTFLEVRRYEKNFLLYKDKDSLQELKHYLGTLKKNIDSIKAEIGANNYERMRDDIAEYEHRVGNIVENFRSQEQLMSMAMTMGRRIEQRLSGGEHEKFLDIRRDEKNLMLFKDEANYESFIRALNSSGLNRYSEIERYRILINKLFDLYKSERDIVDKMRLKARGIESFTTSLSKKERADIDAVSKRSIKLLLYALLTIIILGAIINIKLATNIATPIRRLEEITKKIASGDFSERIDVKGNDEIASLEASFNQMETKLQDAMSSLELAIKRLHEKQVQLVEAEKLASIGILAAGIAHEINNPLTSVLTFSNLMLEQVPEDDPKYERLKMMARETERARNIVRQLLSFAKETPMKPVKMNINQPVKEIIDSLIAQGAFKDIELTLNLQDNLREINVDPVGFGQVVLNIMLNAIHAITPPGKIDVSTKVSENFIEIVFSDTGYGVPEEHISKIFDPFFTTKDVNKGTGLGLAVSYGIIKKHGGDIEVKSTVGKGSTFIVRLPVNG